MSRFWTIIALSLLCSVGLGRLQAAPPAMPATDSLGFTWDINNYGIADNGGQNYTFNNVPYLQTNHGSFNMQGGPSIEKEFLVYRGNMNQIQLVRRVRIDVKTGVGFWVDTITNSSSAQFTTQMKYQISLHGQGPGYVSSTGTANPTTLSKKETGFVIFNNSNRPAILVNLLGPRAQVTPTIQNQNNYRYYIEFPLNLKPGETATYCLAIAQRRMSNTASSKELRKEFAPLHLRYAARGLPRDVRKTLVNTIGGGGGSGAGRNLQTLLEEMGLEQRQEDILSLGETALLTGTARVAPFTIQTEYGVAEVDPKQLAAIRSLNRLEGTMEIHLRNGQILTGKATLNSPISFETRYGSTIDLDMRFIRALVMRIDQDASYAQSVGGFLYTRDGARFALGDQDDITLRAISPWGELQVAYKDLRSVTLVGEGASYGYRFELEDGSRFRAYLADDDLTFQTQAFGPLKVSRVNFTGLTRVRPKVPGQEEDFDDEIKLTHARLWGEAILVGEIDLDTVHFNNNGAVIEIPPAQLRRVEKADAPDPENPRDPRFFEGVLWSGDQVSGGLVEPIIPLRRGDSILEIPASHLMEYQVPAPTLPEAMRERIDRLVADLSHDDWTVRDRATTNLSTIGVIAEGYLTQILKLSADPEVKRRLEKVISEID